MYDILMRKLYSKTLDLLYTLDNAWLMINLVELERNSHPLEPLVSLANDLQIKASLIMDDFACQETSDLSRIYSAVRSNLTISSYLTQLADQLARFNILDSQVALLRKASEDNINRLLTLTEACQNEYLVHLASLIQRDEASRIRNINFNFNHSSLFHQAAALKAEVYQQSQALRDQAFVTITNWKNAIHHAVRSWKPSLSSAPITSSSSSSSSSYVQASATPPTSSAVNQLSAATPQSLSTMPTVKPPTNRFHTKLHEIKAAYAKDHPTIQNREQAIEQIIRLLPQNLELNEEQETRLLETVKTHLSIGYQATRFVSKRLPVLRVDEAALSQAIKQFEQRSTHQHQP